jgi:polyphosphate kinase
VLEEAGDRSIPLYERIKFLAIYSNNLEEFYQVRVSYYRQLLRNADLIPAKIEEVQPARVLHKINEIVNGYLNYFNDIFDNQIIPELEENGIMLLERNATLNEQQSKEVKEIFMTEILSALQPVVLIKERIRPFLKTGQGILLPKW